MRVETLWCCDPAGEWVPNPTPDQVVGYMRQDYDAWGLYSLMVELAWHEHPAQSVLSMTSLGSASLREQLLAVRHPERGWFFEFSSHRGAWRWLVPHDLAADQAEWVRHWAWGEETCFLAGCFVGQAAAERVAADFVATKEPSPAVQWAPFESIIPRLELTEWRRRQRERRPGGRRHRDRPCGGAQDWPWSSAADWAGREPLCLGVDRTVPPIGSFPTGEP